MKNKALVIVLVGLFWSALVLVFDSIVGYGIVNQIRACRFPSVIGVITHSETTTEYASHGDTTGVDIRYHYEVNGHAFEGTRYRYVAGSSSDSKWAKDAVKYYFSGAEVPVFYNPKKPAESLLHPGIDGSDYMWFIFLTPFNMVMLAFWSMGIGFLRNKFFRSPNGRIKTIRDGHFLRIRLPRYPGWAWGMAVTGIVAFIEAFLLAFIGGGFHPKAGLGAAAIVIACASGIAVAVWEWWKTHSGVSDLTIDERDGSIELPLTFGRKTRVPISAADVAGVAVDTVSQNNSSTYVPTLVLRDQKPSDGKLAEWFNKTDAENFATWLRTQLKIAESNKKPAAWKDAMPVPDHGKEE